MSRRWSANFTKKAIRVVMEASLFFTWASTSGRLSRLLYADTSESASDGTTGLALRELEWSSASHSTFGDATSICPVLDSPLQSDRRSSSRPQRASDRPCVRLQTTAGEFSHS